MVRERADWPAAAVPSRARRVNFMASPRMKAVGAARARKVSGRVAIEQDVFSKQSIIPAYKCRGVAAGATS
jgi:hypothetical protein